MKRFALLLVILSAATAPAAAGPGSALPEVRLDERDAPFGTRIGDFVGAAAPSVIAGSSADAPGCAAPDDDRCEAWATAVSQTSGPVAYGEDRAAAATLAPDGQRFYVVGTAAFSIGAFSEVHITAFDPATGAARWTTRRDAGLGLSEVIYDAAVSPDSSKLFIVGAAMVNRPQVGGDLLIMALNATTGAFLWQKTADPGGAADMAYAVDVSPDGRTVVVAGSASNADPFTLGYETTSGNLQWSATDAVGPQEYAVDVAAGASAAYTLAYDQGASSFDTVVRAYDFDGGIERWVARFDGGKSESAQQVVIDESRGRGYLTTLTEVAPQGTVFGTMAFSLVDGGELWRANHGGAIAEVINIPTTIASDPVHDRVFVSGLLVNKSFGDYDFGTVAYDGATGEELWRAVSGSDRDERVWDLAVSADGGEVYLTGRNGPPYAGGTSGGAGTEHATISYDAATGAQRWAARYVGTTPTEIGGDPEGIGVTPDGRRVLVGGSMAYALERPSVVNGRDIVATGYDDAPTG